MEQGATERSVSVTMGAFMEQGATERSVSVTMGAFNCLDSAALNPDPPVGAVLLVTSRSSCI